MSYKTEGKPDLTIVPPVAVRTLATQLIYGADKHGRNNYLTNPAVTNRELVAAIGRHWLDLIERGWIDEDSGLEHLGAIMANCAMILHRRQSTVEENL